MNNVEKAIILAAGKGERMMPLTKTTPKPLIEVLGQPIIEHTIEVLRKKNINEIYIVVGYLAEKFDYLVDKYNVNLIYNNKYNTCNNISSLFLARDHLENSVVLDGDIWITDPDVIKTEFDYSGYTSIQTSDFSDEWVQYVDENDFVTKCSRNGGKNGWILYSISYWNKEDAIQLKEDLENEFQKKQNTDIYWDDVPIFCYPEKYKLQIKRALISSFEEFDSINELAIFDSKYLEVKNEH